MKQIRIHVTLTRQTAHNPNTTLDNTISEIFGKSNSNQVQSLRNRLYHHEATDVIINAEQYGYLRAYGSFAGTNKDLALPVGCRRVSKIEPQRNDNTLLDLT